MRVGRNVSRPNECAPSRTGARKNGSPATKLGFMFRVGLAARVVVFTRRGGFAGAMPVSPVNRSKRIWMGCAIAM